jgi:uncharacterized integral membrane protein
MTNPEHGDRIQPARPPGEPPTSRTAAGKPVVRPSRLGGLWIALTSGAVVLLLLLIFILENSEEVGIAYFGAHGHLPLGVALLLAAILGILLVVIPGGGRMLQLRMAARRQARRAQQRPPQPATPPAPTASAPAPTDPTVP